MTQQQPTLAAIVPVKSFADGKQRLAPLLSPAERNELGRVMLADVLTALAASPGLAEVLVVTSNSAAAKIAKNHGARVLDEAIPGSLNAAVTLASAQLTGSVVDAIIVVPADLPHLTAKTLETCRDALVSPRSAVLVPAVSDGGTNILGMNPIGLIPPFFGPDSFAKHCAAARSAGIEPAVFANSEAARDIDRPDDLAHFFGLGTNTRTQEFLQRIGLAERLAAAVPNARKALEMQA